MYLFIQFLECTENSKPSQIPSKVIPFFQHWNLILGDGSNVGKAIDYQNKDFFYVTGHAEEKWVVFKHKMVFFKTSIALGVCTGVNIHRRELRRV